MNPLLSQNTAPTQYTPDEIRRLSLELEPQLPPRPTMRAVTPNHIPRPDNLRRPRIRTAFPDQLIRIVLCQTTPEQPVGHTGQVLRRRRLLLAEMAQLHRDRVGLRVVGAGLVEFERLGEHAAFDLDGGVFGHVVEEKALDAALVEDDLLEARDAGDGVRDAVRAG